jgi:hypothetical protein
MSEAIALENMMANHHVREQAMRTRFRNDRSQVCPQPIKKTFHKATSSNFTSFEPAAKEAFCRCHQSSDSGGC